jgi:hypothetical protein
MIKTMKKEHESPLDNFEVRQLLLNCQMELLRLNGTSRRIEEALQQLCESSKTVIVEK